MRQHISFRLGIDRTWIASTDGTALGILHDEGKSSVVLIISKFRLPTTVGLSKIVPKPPVFLASFSRLKIEQDGFSPCLIPVWIARFEG